MESKLKEISKSDFVDLVQNGSGLKLVEFGAPWCPPCKALVPTLLTLQSVFSGSVDVYTVDVDKEPELAAKFEIRGLPTVLIFKNSVVLEKFYGKLPLTKYQDFLEAELKK